MTDDFYTLVIGIVLMCAGILICLLEGIRLLYPTIWEGSDILSDVFDREVGIIIKMFVGCAIASIGISLTVYTPTLHEFFEKWDVQYGVKEVAQAPVAQPEIVRSPLDSSSEIPDTLPLLPGRFAPTPTSRVIAGSNSAYSGNNTTVTPSTTGNPPTPVLPGDNLLDREHELPLGQLIRPPRGYTLIQTISHDAPDFWRSVLRWHNFNDPTTFDVVMYGGEFVIPTLHEIAHEDALRKALPRVVASVPGSTLGNVKLPASLFDTGLTQGAAVSATLQTKQGEQAATIYVVPTSRLVLAIIAAGPSVTGGNLRPCVDASIVSMRRKDLVSETEFELQGYAGAVPNDENPWVHLTR